MFQHWDAQNIPIELHQSNHNQHIAKEKENAKIALQQCANYAISELLSSCNNTKLCNLFKFHINKLFDKQIPPIT